MEGAMVEAMMEYFTTLNSYLSLNWWDILQCGILIGIYSKLEKTVDTLKDIYYK
jgi:hypothetical protein